jgi:hypothetical protein
MDDGLASIAIIVLLFDDGRPISIRLALLDHSAIAVTIMIGSLAHGDTGSYRTSMHTNLICDGGCGKRSNRSRY